MHNLNCDVVEALVTWLSAREAVWYVTICQTWGASPRPTGSIFAYNPKRKLQVGSLSGGCVEEDLLAELDQLPNAPRPFKKVYGVTPADVERYQLPCGGRLELLIELHNDDSLSHFSDLLAYLKNNRRIVRAVNLESGKLTLADYDETLVSPLVLDSTLLRHCLGPRFKVLLIGAGEVAKSVASIVSALDFKVVLCDPRQEYLDKHEASLWGVEVHHCLPDDLIEARFSDQYSAILALAHDPRVDDMGLLYALDDHCQAFYIGAMGSEKTTQKRAQRLKSLGLSDKKLNRLVAPIGLAIGSKTPAEIAVSIAAQLIEFRNNSC